MTYTQFRKHLAAVAAFGIAGAPTDAIGRQRLVMLRGAKCVVGPICDRWTLTRLGETIVGEHAMPARRPVHRPSHHARRTPAIGHAPHAHAMRKVG